MKRCKVLPTGQVVDMRSIELQKPLDRMIIWIIRIILIFQVARRNYNTTKIELQEPVTQTIIVIRISLNRCRQEFTNQSNLHLLRLKWLENHKKIYCQWGKNWFLKAKHFVNDHHSFPVEYLQNFQVLGSKQKSANLDPDADGKSLRQRLHTLGLVL